MSKEKTMKTNEKIAALNHVEGFNPEDYARVISDDGSNERKYLDVVWRKVWFLLKYQNGKITTKIIQITNQFIIVEAKVYLDRNDPEENYVSSAMAQRWFKPGDVFSERAVETAETGATGRALANAGFGLQYLCDLNGDGEQDIVDSPVTTPANPQLNTAMGPKNETSGKSGVAADNKSKIKTADVKTGNAAADIGGKKETQTANTTVKPAVQPKLTAPMGLLINTNTPNNAANPVVSKTEKSDETNEPAEDGITEEIPADVNENQTDNPENDEIAGEPEINKDAQTETTESEKPQNLKYDNSMEVNEIAKIMTVEEAIEIVIDCGYNQGKTLGDLGMTKPDKLDWYFRSYTGPNNLLRAGAKIVSDYVAELKKTAA